MKFETLEAIKAHKWAGNHYHDHAAITAAHNFALDVNNSMADRAEALRHTDNAAMGLPRYDDIPDDQLVNEFVAMVTKETAPAEDDEA
ncbi:hypothetical protein KFS98_003565 [Salmonella enterica]|nr:hypothetical protein [Salmonella enterica]